LELHPDKTRLIEFGRFAARDRKARGEGKPETFTFLGFTHYCGQRHKSGTFTVWRITAKKRMVAKLKAIKAELQRRMHDRMAEVGAWLRKVVLGYYQYHAVPGNTTQLTVQICALFATVVVQVDAERPNMIRAAIIDPSVLGRLGLAPYRNFFRTGAQVRNCPFQSRFAVAHPA
jgi:hypothetical protein